VDSAGRLSNSLLSFIRDPERLAETLMAPGEKRDRQAAPLSSRQPYLPIEAILQYLDREGKESGE